MGFIRAVLFYLGIFSGMIILGTPYIIYKGAICRRKNEITNVCAFYFKNIGANAAKRIAAFKRN